MPDLKKCSIPNNELNAPDDGSVQFQVVRNKNLDRRIAEVLERLDDFQANPGIILNRGNGFNTGSHQLMRVIKVGIEQILVESQAAFSRHFDYCPVEAKKL